MLAQSQGQRKMRQKLRIHIGKKEIHQQGHHFCGKCHTIKGESSNKLLSRGCAVSSRLTPGDRNPTTKPQPNPLAMKARTSESRGKTPCCPAHFTESPVVHVLCPPTLPKLLIRGRRQPLVSIARSSLPHSSEPEFITPAALRETSGHQNDC